METIKRDDRLYNELKDKYSLTMGRTGEDVIRMFKYLLLKSYFKLSDRGLIERTETDMLFKYFLIKALKN